MCGIAGLWGAGDMKKMVRLLSHRGPDGESSYFGEKLRFGAASLRIIDSLSENQPLYNEDGSIAVVLNGEIYNYPELKKELNGHVFKTNSDTEVIVHAYEEFGLDFVNKFNGCFALAVWDGEKLILARDRLGQKPLYYFHNNSQFIFASEIKSILSIVEPYPNITENFLVFETTIGDETLFKDIYSVPEASLLIFDGRQITIKNYWKINPDITTTLNERQCIDKMSWLIKDAVQLRLKGDFPVGVFLSGGIDSSLIASLARPRHVFTCHYNLGEPFEELHYAEMVAKDIKAQLHVVRPTWEDFKKYFKRIIWHLDQPIATASTISAFLLAKEASRFNRVILNGEGADELLGGYIRYLLMLTEGQPGESDVFKNYSPLIKYFWNEKMLSEPSKRYFYLTRRGVPKTDLPYKVIKDIFTQHRNLINQMGACDIKISLPSLLVMGERVGAAFGIENRAPYLDYRIVEFTFSLPPEMKVKEYQTKYILRKVAKGLVSDEIINRKDKKGLITPISRWFSNELHGWSNDLISSFKKRQIHIEPGPSRGEFDRYLYIIVSLELWYRTFIEKKTSMRIDK